MCGRYALYTDPKTLLMIFEFSQVPRDLVPRFNIAPSQDVPAVRAGAEGGRELRMLRWGLVPSWSKGPEGGYKMINARAETAAERPAFRAALARRRCLLPADGFYEWRTEGKVRTPHFIHFADGRPMALAGLWEHWQRDGEAIDSCTILTTAANDLVAPIHDRMPVIVDPSDFARWLDPEVTDPLAVEDVMRPFPPDRMEAYPVSRRVNNPRNDDRGCVEPEGA